jgi:hypothetical protein
MDGSSPLHFYPLGFFYPGGRFGGCGLRGRRRNPGIGLARAKSLGHEGKASTRQYVITHNETCIEKQFNPLMRENIPPVIEDMSVKSKEEWGWCWVIPCVKHAWTHVRVRIFDIAPYTVEVKVLDNGKKETFQGFGDQTFDAYIDIDYWSDILVDYKVRVKAVDVAGNEIKMEKKIPGFFGGILEFLEDIWNAIVGIIVAAWEAVLAVLSFLLDWILSALSSIVTPVLTALDGLLHPVVAWVADVCLRAFDGEPGDVISDLLAHPVLQLISTMMLILDVALLVVSALFSIVTVILSLVTSLLMEIIATALGGGFGQEDKGLTDNSPDEGSSFFYALLTLLGIDLKSPKLQGVKNAATKIAKAFPKILRRYRQGMGISKSVAVFTGILLAGNYISLKIGYHLEDADAPPDAFFFAGLMGIVFNVLTLITYISKVRPYGFIWTVIWGVVIALAGFNIYNFASAMMSGEFAYRIIP